MAIKPHLKLNVEFQSDKPINLKYNYGFGDAKVEHSENSELNLKRTARSFNIQRALFTKRLERRLLARTLDIPAHINYIDIQFHGQFNIPIFFQSWLNDFGLTAVRYSKFNTAVLFAVHGDLGAQTFINNIDRFIARELDGHDNVEYDRKVRFVRSFTLLTTDNIMKAEENARLLNFDLADFPLPEIDAEIIRQTLLLYLEEKKFKYRYLPTTNTLEIEEISIENAELIIKNFDVITQVTSSLSTVIGPSKFNQPERSYGFYIENENENLPIIGILDTGISTSTPLGPIVINDETLNLTQSHAFEDNANQGSGHGTGVAALAALGRNAYVRGFSGAIRTDARLLSIKILDNNSGSISQDEVLRLLHSAVQKHSVSIFVLTICFSKNKAENEDFSSYAYKLDRFAHENDALIFICTSNNNDAISNNTDYNFEYFNDSSANLSTPAESMNNVTVGAVADCLRGGVFFGISPQREFPTLYTRKGHINLSKFKNKQNSRYFKPDLLECGGDYEKDGNFIGTGSKATMNILSADPTESFYQDAGTSFSAPLAANSAAQIKLLYPNIKMQSVKALILNAASLNKIVFPSEHESLKNRTTGNGLADTHRSLHSDDDSITFLIEDSIMPEKFKSYPIHFPEYLLTEKLGKKMGILQITATLCFSFNPVMNNQLAYCPIHMGFSFYRNHTGEMIQEVDRLSKSKLTSTLSWSQNGRNKTNPIPYSNSQKITMPVNIQQLVDESGIFKLALNCRVCPQLTADKLGEYNHPHPFSIAIRIENKLKENSLTGRLYTEMEAINNLTSIINLDSDLTLENEV